MKIMASILRKKDMCIFVQHVKFQEYRYSPSGLWLCLTIGSDLNRNFLYLLKQVGFWREWKGTIIKAPLLRTRYVLSVLFTLVNLLFIIITWGRNYCFILYIQSPCIVIYSMYIYNIYIYVHILY